MTDATLTHHRPRSRGFLPNPPPADSGTYAMRLPSIDGRDRTHERDDLRWRRDLVLAVLRKAGTSGRHTIGHVAVYMAGQPAAVAESIELRDVFPGSTSRVKLARVLELVETGLVDGRVPFSMNTGRALR